MLKGLAAISLLGLAVFPFPIFAATLTEYVGDTIDDSLNWGSTGVEGQSFKVPSDSCVTGIEIHAKRDTLYFDNAFSFWINDAQNNSGVVVATTTVSASVVPLTSYEWVPINFDVGGSVTAATTYYIISKGGGLTNNVLRWALDGTSPSYTDGVAQDNYSNVTGYDSWFRVIGNVGVCAASPATSTTSYSTASSSMSRSIDDVSFYSILIFLGSVVGTILVWLYVV